MSLTLCPHSILAACTKLEFASKIWSLWKCWRISLQCMLAPPGPHWNQGLAKAQDNRLQLLQAWEAQGAPDHQCCCIRCRIHIAGCSSSMATDDMPSPYLAAKPLCNILLAQVAAMPFVHWVFCIEIPKKNAQNALIPHYAVIMTKWYDAQWTLCCLWMLAFCRWAKCDNILQEKPWRSNADQNIIWENQQGWWCLTIFNLWHSRTDSVF